MAKTYAVENISSTPARPILLVLGTSKGAVGDDVKNLATDGIPMTLTEKEYIGIKEVLDRYEKADMVRVKCIEDTPKKVAQKTEEVSEEEALATLRQTAKDLGVRGWQSMRQETLEEAIVRKTLENGSDDTE